MFHSDELSALDRWVRRGNTLLINAALLDQPDWAARRSAGAVVEIESLTAIEFETRKGRESRLDDTPLAERVREADARDARRKDEEEERRRGSEESRTRSSRAQSCSTFPANHAHRHRPACVASPE